MNRASIVAGQFYPESAKELHTAVDQYLNLATNPQSVPTLLAMVPHAGYVFSGAVCGKTLGKSNLHPTVLLLGPNHTGMGHRLALWGDGHWQIPGAQVPVATTLAQRVLEHIPQVQVSREAHTQEHSLEVLLPFLHRLHTDIKILPLAIAESNPETLQTLGIALAKVLLTHDEPVSIVVSSDMSHYVSHELASAKDSLAIAQALALNPKGLLSVVRDNNISMCGVLPMTLGLFAAREMGVQEAELVAYATSGNVNGDFDQVVGYAGVLCS